MSSGAGLVLAEERRDEEGEGSDRMRSPGGGDGERVRTLSSDSQSEGGSVSGELGPALNKKDAIVKGRRVVCVFAAGAEVVDAFGSDDRCRAAEGAATNNAAQLRDAAANAADLDTTHDSSSSDRDAHAITTALQQAGY